jgi:hypothetical protein
MAFTLSRNLKLRIDSNLTANSKYNLERIDLLGSTFLVDSTNALNVRSQTDILIEPNSADVGGSGSGGSVTIGSANHLISTLSLYASAVELPVSLGLKDQGTNGSKYLRLKYDSTLEGAVDGVADRSLTLDLGIADRQMILGGNYSQLGGSLSWTLGGDSALTLPLTGTLATLSGTETLVAKTMSGLSNTFTQIQYASLALTGSIVDADVSGTAAISYSKLALGSSIVNSDVSSSAAIAYSKLALTSSLVDGDISAAASIARSKVAAGTSNHVLINGPTGLLSSEAQLSISRGGTGAGTAADAITALLPSQSGQSGKYLKTDGTTASWQVSSGGGGGGSSYAADWVTADGTTIVVTHSLGSTDVQVSIIDLDDDQLIGVQSVVVTDSNTVTLTSSEAPFSIWRVVVQA